MSEITDIPGKPPVAVEVKLTAERKPTWLDDIHVNGSGLFMFICGALAIFWPDHKEQLNELTVLAGTYLFASAKAKS